MVLKSSFIFLCIVFIFTSCAKRDIEKIVQTNSAIMINHNYYKINQLILQLKEKLDKRNSSSYNKDIALKITRLIRSLDNNFLLKYKHTTLENYKDYLHIAFSKNNIKNRNDYLILGIYYLVFDSYGIKDGMKLTALMYDEEKLLKLHKNLQIIKWKLKASRDNENKYLFLTWQQNWQIALEKKINLNKNFSFSVLNKIEYLKNNKASLLGSSDFSFEILLTKMIDNVENSLTTLKVTPIDVGVNTLRTIFLFL